MKGKMTISRLIMALIITTIIVLIFSLSRYSSTVATRNTTKIAAMANDVNISIEDTIDGYPGSEAYVYPISITNSLDGKICEISQKFNLKITGLEEANIPLEIGLYKDSSCNNKITDNNGVYESEEFKFNAGVEETKNFYLKINWPSNKNSDFYSLEIDYLKINITLTQID